MTGRLQVEIERLQAELDGGERILDESFLQVVKRLMNLDPDYSKSGTKSISTPEVLRWWRKRTAKAHEEEKSESQFLASWRHNRPQRRQMSTEESVHPPVQPIEEPIEESLEEPTEESIEEITQETDPPIQRIENNILFPEIADEKTVELAVHHFSQKLKRSSLSLQDEILPTIRLIMDHFSIFPTARIKELNSVELLSWWQLQGGVSIGKEGEMGVLQPPKKKRVPLVEEDKYSEDIAFFLGWTQHFREAKRQFEMESIDAKAYDLQKKKLLDRLHLRCPPQSKSKRLIIYGQWRIEGLISKEEYEKEKNRDG